MSGSFGGWIYKNSPILITKKPDLNDPGPAVPGKRIEETSNSFMHAPLGSGDIAQLVDLRSCNWVVAITGWMSNCPGGNDSILYLNWWLTFSK